MCRGAKCNSRISVPSHFIYVTVMHTHIGGENVCSWALYRNFGSLQISTQDTRSLKDNVGLCYGPLRSSSVADRMSQNCTLVVETTVQKTYRCQTMREEKSDK